MREQRLREVGRPPRVAQLVRRLGFCPLCCLLCCHLARSTVHPREQRETLLLLGGVKEGFCFNLKKCQNLHAWMRLSFEKFTLEGSSYSDHATCLVNFCSCFCIVFYLFISACTKRQRSKSKSSSLHYLDPPALSFQGFSCGKFTLMHPLPPERSCLSFGSFICKHF